MPSVPQFNRPLTISSNGTIYRGLARGQTGAGGATTQLGGRRRGNFRAIYRALRVGVRRRRRRRRRMGRGIVLP